MVPILVVFIKFYKAFNLLVKLRFLALTRKIKANEYTKKYASLIQKKVPNWLMWLQVVCIVEGMCT